VKRLNQVTVRGLLTLHYQIRHSLAEEKVILIPRKDGREEEFRYIISSGLLPMRKGTTLLPVGTLEDDVKILAHFFLFLKVHLSEKIGLISVHNPASIADLVSVLRKKRREGEDWIWSDWEKIRRTVYRTAHFIGRWKGRFEWEGSIFDFYWRNRDNWNYLVYVHNKIIAGNVLKVVFREGRALFLSVRTGRFSSRTVGQPYSYRRAQKVRFLPGPVNRWGEDDFLLSPEELRSRIRLFLEGIERRLGIDPITIQRELDLPHYHKVRLGKHGMGLYYLSDATLEKLGLSEEEKEWLRHHETLLAVARDMKSEPERGPYRREGRLLRYFRILHHIPLARVRHVYIDKLFGGSEVEMGRAGLPDRKKILRIAQTIGVPKIYERALGDHLLQSYERVFQTLAPESKEKVTVFPNPEWLIPYESFSTRDLRTLLGRMARKLRGRLTREELARKAGLAEGQIEILERKGSLAPKTQARLERFLSHELRILRGALELRYHPIPDRGGFYVAGRLLRFTRALIPGGMSVGEVIQELRLEVNMTAYSRWEWGITEVPPDILRRYSRCLVEKGVLTAPQAKAFVARVQEVYGRRPALSL
jgi:hypothetical protein